MIQIPQEIREYLEKNPGVGRYNLARKFNIGERHSRTILKTFHVEHKDTPGQISIKKEFNENGNMAEAIAKTYGSPLSQEDMLELFKIDTTIWKVDKFRVNSWVVTSWKTGKQEAATNYQTRLDLIRIIPLEQEIPALKRIVINMPSAPKGAYQQQSLNRCLILSDSQNGYIRDMVTGKLTPFHDRRIWDIALQTADIYQPHKIILLGDMLDLSDWSDHYTISGESYFTFQPALIELYWWLSRLRVVCPNAEMVYLEGNHEQRMTRVILNNLLAAYKIKPANQPKNPPALSIENLMGLQELGIRYLGDYPKNNYWLNDNLEVLHGEIVRTGSGDTVKTVLKDARNSMIFGHGHRREMANKTVHPKDRIIFYTVAMVGCMCHVDGRVPSQKGTENWQNGLMKVDYEDSNGLFEIRDIPINNGIALYDGHRLVGDDDISELKPMWEAF